MCSTGNKGTEIQMKQKTYRICDGYLWRWESCGDYVRAIKICAMPNEADAEDFAEALITEINENADHIIYNLNSK